MEFKGKTAIVTGAASGMGLLSARKLAEVVDLILYLCSEKAAFITGSNYLIDGGRACGGACYIEKE